MRNIKTKMKLVGLLVIASIIGFVIYESPIPSSTPNPNQAYSTPLNTKIVDVDIIQAKIVQESLVVKGSYAGKINITVRDSNKKIVAESKNMEGQDFIWSVNTSDWALGYYWVTISSDALIGENVIAVRRVNIF